jgi:hypothetical protein
MNARPTDGRDEPETVDEAMLAILSNSGRAAAVLSADQERLLDDWVAGRLSPQAARQAADLVKRNALAAERILERRLLAAAEQGPAVPPGLAARALGSQPRPQARAARLPWRPFGRWSWTGIAGAAALASIVAIAGVVVLQQAMRGGAPIQVAMVTIGDRTPLFEPSDIRMRGSPQGSPADQRFRDVDMPAGVLGELVAAPATPSPAATRALETYLSLPGDSTGQPVRVIVDAALGEKLRGRPAGEGIPVRIYDLRDPRTADIRGLAGALPDSGRAYLLTVRP